MKTWLSAFSLILTSAAIAQSNSIGPADVCRRISAWNTSAGAECAQNISRARFDQGLLDVAYGLANRGGTTQANLTLRVGGNRRLDDNMARVCLRVVDWNMTGALKCVENSLDASFNPSAVEISLSLADRGATSQAADAIFAARDAYLHQGAAGVCMKIAERNTTSTVTCVQTIVNRDFFNGTETICHDLADRGAINQAITCLKNSGIESSPLPPMPTEIVMSSVQFMDISRHVKRAEAVLARGNRLEAQRLLQDVSRMLEDVNIQNGSSQGGPGRGVRR